MPNNVISNVKSDPDITDTLVERGDESVPVRYRIVADDEIRTLKPLFDALGWPLPDPGMAKVLVAEAGEGTQAVIVGFQVIQGVWHAEPMWCHPSVRGSGVAEALVKQTVHYLEHDCHITKYIVLAKPGSFAARLAEQYGMMAVPGQVFVRVVHETTH